MTGAGLTRENVLSVRQAAELLSLPVSTVNDYARRGLLPGRRIGRRRLFLRDELDACLRDPARLEGPERERE